MTWLRALGFIGAFAVLIGIVFRPIHTVSDQEMAPGLAPGDRVWLADSAANIGDVVLLKDPLDPKRTILRRVLATAGATVSFAGGVATVGEEALEHIEMFRDKTVVVLQEREQYQIQREPGPTNLRIAPIKVPPGHVFLAADNRGLAIDSRWWGPVPESEIQAVAIWRIGHANAWQDRTGRP